MRPDPTKKQIEQRIKLTDIQKRWLNNYLEACRDRQAEKLYELTREQSKPARSGRILSRDFLKR